MGGFKITGLGAGTVGGDAVRLSQLQAGTAQLLTVSGTDTLTALGTPAVTAYTTGNLFYFVAAATNTTSVTLNVDGLGARNMTRHGSVALVAGDILVGEVCIVVYDGTRFQLLNPASYTNLNVSGVLSLAAGAVGTPSLAASGDLNTGIFFPAADTIAASVGGVEGWRLTSAGNLGIGTTNPQYRLDLQSSAALGFRLKGGSGTNQGSALLGTYAGSSSTLYAFGDRASLFGGTPDQLVSIFTGGTALTFDVNGGEKARIDTSGNLGIGTSSPAFALGSGVVIQRAGIATLRLENSSGLNSLEIAADSTANGIRFYGINNAPFVFAPDATERMRLDTSGNLGVGVAAFGTAAAKVIGMANATAPTSSPAGMGQLYVEAGALKYRGSSGTVTTIANA
jgi:hypothetical protein